MLEEFPGPIGFQKPMFDEGDIEHTKLTHIGQLVKHLEY